MSTFFKISALALLIAVSAGAAANAASLANSDGNQFYHDESIAGSGR
jgi:hypothetical protein